MASEEQASSLAGLGEFAVIDRIVAGRNQPGIVAVGPGDDAAVVVARDGRTVVSTDMLVEGRHFRREWAQARDIGRKAAAANAAPKQKEFQGPKGPEPTRYGDWERKGIASDF